MPESLLVMMQEAAVGLPEIIAKTFVFALVFYAWEKRSKRKVDLAAA